MAKVDLRSFDYKKIGQLDAQMWRAYYNHQFVRLFWLLLNLIKEQLGLNWIVTIKLAYYSGLAAADYRLHRGNVNNRRVLGNITKFDKLISNHAIAPFDYKQAAGLELSWWDVHRSSHKNNKLLEESLAQASAAIYKVKPSDLKYYAHFRAEAMILPQHKGDNPDNPTDWPKIQELTIKSWQSLYSAIQK